MQFIITVWMLNWFRIILSTLHIIWKDTSPEQSQNIDNNLHYLTKPILTKNSTIQQQ